MTPLESPCEWSRGSRPSEQMVPLANQEPGRSNCLVSPVLWVPTPSPKFSSPRCEDGKLWRPLSLENGFVGFETGLHVVQVGLKFTV